MNKKNNLWYNNKNIYILKKRNICTILKPGNNNITGRAAAREVGGIMLWRKKKSRLCGSNLFAAEGRFLWLWSSTKKLKPFGKDVWKKRSCWWILGKKKQLDFIEGSEVLTRQPHHQTNKKSPEQNGFQGKTGLLSPKNTSTPINSNQPLSELSRTDEEEEELLIKKDALRHLTLTSKCFFHLHIQLQTAH